MTNEGIVFDIQRWSIRDGYGIRTNVFLKGCPLGCKWCSNPESQKMQSELAFFPDKCIGCGNCLRNCTHGAIVDTEQGRFIDRSMCSQFCYAEDGDFPCTRQCYAEALKRMGRLMDVDAVMREVLSDRGIYETSGGGVTFTGGEPFMQPEFLSALLQRSKAEGIHTTIETCASVPWRSIEQSLPYIDFVFADLKILEEAKHRQYTNVSNRLILENLMKLDHWAGENGRTLAIRTPVIPGINGAPEEIDATAGWIRSNLKHVNVFQLLPYHRLGRGKYQNIGGTYEMDEIEPPTDEAMEALCQIVHAHGLRSSYD